MNANQMKWRYNSALGRHIHVTVFVNGANCGNLCFRVDEFEEIRRESNRTGLIQFEDGNALLSELDKTKGE